MAEFDPAHDPLHRAVERLEVYLRAAHAGPLEHTAHFLAKAVAQVETVRKHLPNAHMRQPSSPLPG